MKTLEIASPHARCMVTILVACMLGWSAAAQSPKASPAPAPTQPLPTQPLPTQPLPGTLPSPGKLPVPTVTVSPKLLIGKWVHVREDAETRTSDNLVIEFLADGRYTAKNRHSLFPTPEKPGTGRYSISNLQANGFDLRVERNLVEPESDPRDAVEVQRVTVVDANTLMAADGSLIRRFKE